MRTAQQPSLAVVILSKYVAPLLFALRYAVLRLISVTMGVTVVFVAAYAFSRLFGLHIPLIDDTLTYIHQSIVGQGT